MSYVNQGLGSAAAAPGVVKHFLRRYGRHAPAVAPVVQAMLAEGVTELAAQAPPAVVADVAVDAGDVDRQRDGIFGQPQGVFGPMLGGVATRRRRRRQRLAPSYPAVRPWPALKPGQYRSVKLVRSYFPWISSGELVDDGAASFSVAKQGVNWVRLNFYDRGGILVDQQDFYPAGAMSGLLVPNFMASLGPTMLRPAPAADVVELQLDAMDAGVPTDAGTAGMGSYRRGGLGALMVSTAGDPIKTPPPVQDSKGTIAPAQSGNMVSASTRTLQDQLRKVGAGCIAMDGKWGPNTAGAYARWAASSSQNSRAQRSATATAAPAVGAQTVYIDEVAKRTLAAESTGRTDQCGRETVTSTTTSLVDQISPDMVVVDGGGEGVPGWVWGVSAAILGVGVLGAVAVAKSGKDAPSAPTAARKTPRKKAAAKAAPRKTTRRKPTRKTSKRATSKRKTSKRYR